MWNIRILAPASIAIATAVIAIGIGLHMKQAPFAPVLSPGRELMRSQSVDVIAPLGDVRSAPTELEWRPVNGATSYRVRLLEVDRTELWSTTVSQTHVAIPDNVQKNIVPLKRLLWDVSAVNDSGAVLASSGAQAFRLESSAAR